MHITERLAQAVHAAIAAAQSAEALPPFDIPTIVIERPRDASHGDYATTMALRLAKTARRKPRSIAEAIAAHMGEHDYLAEMTIAGPGFINFRLTEGYLQSVMGAILSEGAAFGRSSAGDGKRAQIECVSANPTGPITIGRTRGGVIGDTLGRLMRHAGYHVELEYYYNDAGRQIQLLGESSQIRYLQALGDDVELGADHYKGGYLNEIAQTLVDEHGDSLRDNSSDWFAGYATNIISDQQKHSLESIHVSHDTWFNEANLYSDGRLESTLEQLEKNGHLYQQDGAWWIKTTDFGDDKDRVVIRSKEVDGRPTYRMGDIVYHKDKADRGFDVVVDIFGPDHHAVAPQVLMGVQMLGYDTSFVHTLLHQIVNLTRDGKQLKMSTRRGIYVTLDELVDEVGPDPVRYFMVSRSSNSHVNFDLNLAIERSDKNPVYYIQNAHVRCAGIFRKWEESGRTLDEAADADLSLLTHPRELAFARKAMELHEVINLSVENYEPHHITFYAYDLAAAFHPMYDACRVLSDDVSDDLALARIRLYQAAKSLLALVLDLMGMSAPDRM